MTVSLADHDVSFDQSLGEQAHEVICLVKRHAYELAFTIPHAPIALAHGAQPSLHIRIKTLCPTGGFILSLDDLRCFYEDLLLMMEYLRSERQKITPA
jgi:hypothetical protein